MTKSGAKSILKHLRKGAMWMPFQHHNEHLVAIGSMTSILGPPHVSVPGHGLFLNSTHYAIVEKPSQSVPLQRFAHFVRAKELEHLADGTMHVLVDRVVPVTSIGALKAGRSTVHCPAGKTAVTRLRLNGLALAKAAVEEAERCIAAARRARKPENRGALAEHGRIALEAARFVASDFELGTDVVVPSYALMAPDLWAYVAEAYAREDRLRDSGTEVPADDIEALCAL